MQRKWTAFVAKTRGSSASLFPHMQIRFSNDAAHIRSRRLHVQKILPL